MRGPRRAAHRCLRRRAAGGQRAGAARQPAAAIQRAAERVDDAADPAVGHRQRVAAILQARYSATEGAGAEQPVGGRVGHRLRAAVAEADDLGGNGDAGARPQLHQVADREVVGKTDDVDREAGYVGDAAVHADRGEIGEAGDRRVEPVVQGLSVMPRECGGRVEESG